MVSKLALLSNFFFAFVALAVLPSQLGAPRDGRSELYRPNPDWAGVRCTPSQSTPYNYVTADFVLPNVWPEPPDAFDGGVRLGVVLGDLDCNKAILSTVQLTILNGEAYYFGVYGSQLNTVHNSTSKATKVGDHMRVVAYVSTLVGLAIVENQTAGWIASGVVSLDTNSFCGGPAHWILQDYKEKDRYVSLAAFNYVEFYHCLTSSPAADPDACIPQKADELSLIERDDGPPLTYVVPWDSSLKFGFQWSG